MQYSANWTEVEYTYHQYAEFVPESSCPTCLLNATITGINRGYLQFLSASGQAGIDNESGVIYQLTPITLAVIRDSMIAAISAPNPNSPTIVQDTIAQWTDCSTLLVSTKAYYFFYQIDYGNIIFYGSIGLLHKKKIS